RAHSIRFFTYLVQTSDCFFRGKIVALKNHDPSTHNYQIATRIQALQNPQLPSNFGQEYLN
ncbi:MAG TPA: hypothetical protein DEQ60_03520, partial [Methylophaga sp.]|nr:hypothetical protein [Methylophaga sp.]